MYLIPRNARRNKQTDGDMASLFSSFTKRVLPQQQQQQEQTAPAAAAEHYVVVDRYADGRVQVVDADAAVEVVHEDDGDEEYEDVPESDAAKSDGFAAAKARPFYHAQRSRANPSGARVAPSVHHLQRELEMAKRRSKIAKKKHSVARALQTLRQQQQEEQAPTVAGAERIGAGPMISPAPASAAGAAEAVVAERDAQEAVDAAAAAPDADKTAKPPKPVVSVEDIARRIMDRYTRYIEMLREPFVQFAYIVAGHTGHTVEEMLKKMPSDYESFIRRLDRAEVDVAEANSRMVGALREATLPGMPGTPLKIGAKVSSGKKQQQQQQHPTADIRRQVQRAGQFIQHLVRELDDPGKNPGAFSAILSGVKPALNRLATQAERLESVAGGELAPALPIGASVDEIRRAANEQYAQLNARYAELMRQYRSMNRKTHTTQEVVSNFDQRHQVLNEIIGTLHQSMEDMHQEATAPYAQLRSVFADHVRDVVDDAFEGLRAERVRQLIARPEYLRQFVYSEGLCAAVQKAYGDIRYQSNNFDVQLHELMFQDAYGVATRFAEMVACCFNKNEFAANARRCKARYYPQSASNDYEEEYRRHILYFQQVKRAGGSLAPANTNLYSGASGAGPATLNGYASPTTGAAPIGAAAAAADDGRSFMFSVADLVDGIRGQGSFKYI
jgi:hypothetical protein